MNSHKLQQVQKRSKWLQTDLVIPLILFRSFFYEPLACVKFCPSVSAGAYYSAQPQYPPSVQAAPVIINPAQQQQQAPPPQQPPAQSQGPLKRERKPVVCHNKRESHLLSEVKKWMEGKCIVLFNVELSFLPQNNNSI